MMAMARKTLMTALKVLGVLILLAAAFYFGDRYLTDQAERQEVEGIKGQLRASDQNGQALIARSDVPGYWLYMLDRDAAILRGEQKEVANATVGEIVFNVQQSKTNAFAILKDYFTENGWKIGTDDFKLGKLSFSKDSIGQLVFVTVEELNSQQSQITIKRIVAHE
jgi:hypothetical protein